jgi:hypothetical protein
MKTIRETILHRHQAAQPQLDALRRAALVPLTPARPRRFAQAAWEELFWNCRRAWLGIAAIWVAIFILQTGEESTRGSRATATNSDPASWRMAVAEQQRLRQELQEGIPAPAAAEPGSKASTAPRSQRNTSQAAG